MQKWIQNSISFIFSHYKIHIIEKKFHKNYGSQFNFWKIEKILSYILIQFMFLLNNMCSNIEQKIQDDTARTIWTIGEKFERSFALYLETNILVWLEWSWGLRRYFQLCKSQSVSFYLRKIISNTCRMYSCFLGKQRILLMA